MTPPLSMEKVGGLGAYTLTTPHWGARLANALINLHEHYPEDDEALQMVEGLGEIHLGAICELAENSSALRSAATSGITVRAYTASGGNIGSWHQGINLALKYFSDDVEKVQHTNPYIYLEPNDAIVSRASQGAGLPGVNFPDLLHSIVGIGSLMAPSLFTVTGSSEVASQIYSDLDRPEGWTTSLPPFEVAELQVGVPLQGGRGAQIDHDNFVSQCMPGSPMYPQQ